MAKQTEGSTRREFIAAGAGAAAVAAIGFNRVAQAEDTSELVIQLVHMKMQEGKEEQAIALLTELTKAVEDNEPGVLAYSALRSQKDPLEIIFFEIYKDAAAAASHGAAPHMRAAFPKFGAVFQPGMSISKVDRVAGYTRAS